jgi:multiple sugar transport system permease protein
MKHRNRISAVPFKPGVVTSRRVSTYTLEQRERRFAIACILPAVLLISVLIVYPVIYTIWLSLHDRNLFASSGQFVGLENYVYFLTSTEFWRSLYNGIVFSVGSLLLQMILGVSLALLLNRNFVGRNIVRGALMFPYLVPTVVAILLFRWMLNDLYGIVNVWLMDLGVIDTPIAWFGDPTLAMVSLIGINTWMFYPFVLLCVLARLQSIPPELYEAARIDGAGPVAQFWYITLPQIWGTLALVLLVRTLWMFNKFDTVWLTTQGGPFGSTQTLPVLAYIRAFSLFEIGRGAAVGILLCVVLLGVFAIYYRSLVRNSGQA